MTDITTMLQKAFLEGYATSELQIPTMFMCVVSTAIIASFIYIVYKCVNKNSFYNSNFNMSLIALAVITAAIILTIQSNIVVSLGMVGALSIVRFRTAIKDPLDLVFLFWSISVGIICGAGFAMIAVIASVVLTIIIVVFSMIRGDNGTQVLVVNSPSYDCENRVMELVEESTSYAKIRARNVTDHNMNMAIEVRTRHPDRLIASLMESRAVSSVSLVEHDGEITA